MVMGFYQRTTDLFTQLRDAPQSYTGAGDNLVAVNTGATGLTFVKISNLNSLLDHGTLTGLADDDHSQYALLNGRSGGQILYGSTVASENLRIGSTSDATKGNVRCDSNLVPHVNNTYNLGLSSLKWKRLITVEGLEISANQYAFRVSGTTSGMYFNSTPPRYIGLHINGVEKHTFYMGSSGDEGAYWRVLRGSDPTNATNQGTEYTYDDGAGNSWVRILSQGVYVEQEQRELIQPTASATITLTHNPFTNVYALWTATQDETVNASGGQWTGQRLDILIECDGTARTITFGTNFRANGNAVLTINTGATFYFVSNGTDWCEVARTIGI